MGGTCWDAAWASGKARLILCQGLPGGFGGLRAQPEVLAMVPQHSFSRAASGSWGELWCWLRQAEVVLQRRTPPRLRAQEKGADPSPALGPGQRRRYNNGEIVAGPGLCLRTRAAAGSDYAATMFCSINIMSSLNLY